MLFRQEVNAVPTPAPCGRCAFQRTRYWARVKVPRRWAAVLLGFWNEAGDCPPQGKGLALAVGVKAKNLSRFHTLWVNGSFPLHPSRPCSRATVVAQVQQ